MLKVFAVLAVGVMAGRASAGRGSGAVARLTVRIVWLLLFLLGAEAGADEVVVRGAAELGGRALALCGGGLAGSIAMAWLLWRWIAPERRRR